MKYVIYLSLFLFFISCESSSDEDRISLSKSEIAFDSSGGEEVIAIEANGEWKVGDVPEWITIDQSRRFTSNEVVVTVGENDSRDPREAVISFVLKDKVATLKVSQEKRELTWSSLGFSKFEDVKFSPTADNNGGVFEFEVSEMFVNPADNKILDKIFLGNLINRSLDENLDIPVFGGYTFNPITVSTSAFFKSTGYFPSKLSDDDYMKQILVSRPVQSLSFYSNGGSVRYTSRKELNLIGFSNMGVKLDEIISGQSYKDLEMEKKHGIIYSFSQTLFSLDMNLTFNLVKETLYKGDFPNNSLSYIYSISYGRVGLLVIESDYDARKVKSVVNAVLRDNQAILTQEEKTIIQELDAYHIYYTDSKLMVVKGGIEAIQSYERQIANDIYKVYPIGFSVIDYFNISTESMIFSLTY